MPVQHAVLALLDGSPRHGYGLKSDFEAAVGPGWGGLNIGNLNKLLSQMARDGLIISKPVPQRGADRLVHRITAAGRRELDEWLMQASARPAGYRDDFILKLLAASRRGPDDIRDVCQTEREARMADLAALRELRRGQSAADPVAIMALEIAIIHAQADLKAIDLAEEHADDPRPADAAASGTADGAADSPAEDAALAGLEPARRRTAS
jgi:DNA-binding PadR family transcriptional regulator